MKSSSVRHVKNFKFRFTKQHSAQINSLTEQASIELLFEVEKVILKIQQNPNLGTPHKIEGIRRYAIQRFSYLIFYTVLEEVIWVIA
ncbi:MAG: hypothetical protein V7K71_11655 [Nostoc sp.]|uniref:hypothetical protein n=1 Tax=Nostoc sp. TaxID=1180 RepID=UPI002FF58012